ncbi:MAG: amidohydrolase family protein, partial [Armatimonadota bacterium]
CGRRPESGACMMIVDAHVHCGVQNVDQSYDVISPLLSKAGADAAVMFPPVEDVYDRHDPTFTDTPEWQECRRRANDYVVDLARSTGPCLNPVPDPALDREPGPVRDRVHPFFFVWNDFRADLLHDGHKGIKWHRHPDEPTYNYDDPRCREMLEAIVARGLPITVEETYENTMLLVNELAPEATFVVPHVGKMNGGFGRLAADGLWERPNVWADTSMATFLDLTAYVECCGVQRLMFGSDYPFGVPAGQIETIRALKLDAEDEAAVLGDNVMRLLGGAPEQG